MRDDEFIDVTSLGAADMLEAVRDGRIRAEELVNALLARIRADEDRVARGHSSTSSALEQARNVDRVRREGHPMGPLHGLPVGVKDIIDTADMPTENGTVLHAGRRPMDDATVVERLRSAGAIILGKTVTTELATYAPVSMSHFTVRAANARCESRISLNSGLPAAYFAATVS
ncbi:MAG: amidase family protein [Burkholderiaceae bacterium]